MLALWRVMLLRRFTFTNVTVRRLAPSGNSRDLSGFFFNQAKPKLSGFLLERNNCIFGVLRRKLGLWNPPISMCGPEEIPLQVFTQNLRPRNEPNALRRSIRHDLANTAFVASFATG